MVGHTTKWNVIIVLGITPQPRDDTHTLFNNETLITIWTVSEAATVRVIQVDALYIFKRVLYNIAAMGTVAGACLARSSRYTIRAAGQ